MIQGLLGKTGPDWNTCIVPEKNSMICWSGLTSNDIDYKSTENKRRQIDSMVIASFLKFVS